MIKDKKKRPSRDQSEPTALRASIWTPKKTKNMPTRLGCLTKDHGPVVTIFDLLFEDTLSSLSLSNSIIIPKMHTKIPRISSILSSEYPER